MGVGMLGFRPVLSVMGAVMRMGWCSAPIVAEIVGFFVVCSAYCLFCFTYQFPVVAYLKKCPYIGKIAYQFPVCKKRTEYIYKRGYFHDSSWFSIASQCEIQSLLQARIFS
uniref:Uncharacterized protein n=1 Tax=Opuntia streptacantha TaxID=393608 RepID=A0A7C9CPP6_OPUST